MLLRRVLPSLALLLLIGGSAAPDAQSLRKLGEMELALIGLEAAVDPVNPVVPRNTPAGVRIVVRGGAGEVALADLRRFFGADLHVAGDFSGPGLADRALLTSAGQGDPLLLRLPAVHVAGDYQLSNLRLVAQGRTVLDVTPNRVRVDVIEQVFITSVTTRPLTRDEITDRGIVLDRDDFLGFEFTMGVTLESRPIQLRFPVVFDSRGAPLPEFTRITPRSMAPEVDIPSLPVIAPMMLVIEAPSTGQFIPRLASGQVVDVRIPSVLVIPGSVGFLKQFFSAQLFVANGAPGGSGLSVRDVEGTIKLPAGLDREPETSDDPLSLPETTTGPAAATRTVAHVGLDGAAGTADDVARLQPGDQGQAEFLIRGDAEGFHQIDFDIAGTLDGLATGPARVTGTATGGVLVRNPYLDMSFAVPSVVRTGERFTLYATVTNKPESGPANNLQVTLDAVSMSGMRLDGPATQTIPTLMPGDARTVAFDFISESTGQVTASYLRFDTTTGAEGTMRFTAGIGERGIALSPDTLVLPSRVDGLPAAVVDAAMRVLGQAWSIALVGPGQRPVGVLPITRSTIGRKGLALAEAGLRVSLGVPLADALRDLGLDFYGPSPDAQAAFDAGFDQLLRQTDAGDTFRRALGAALTEAVTTAGGPAAYQRALAALLTSGPDQITVAVSGGAVDVAIVDASGKRTSTAARTPLPLSDVRSAVWLPATTGNDTALVGLITSPAAGPYTVEITARDAASYELAVSFARGDGTHLRAVRSGSLEMPGGQATFQLTPNSFPGAETVNAQGPQLTAATIVGPELLASAQPLGFHAALLFDRPVAARQSSDGEVELADFFTVPDNVVRRVAPLLSGRVLLAELRQPESDHVPTTLRTTGVVDRRDVRGPTAEVALASRLIDPGAVVTGRVLTADGLPLGGVDVAYGNVYVTGRGECPEAGRQLLRSRALARTAADGSFTLRYVHKDVICGQPFRLWAIDPQTGFERAVVRHVQSDNERIAIDLVMLGQGAVAGIVRDLQGQPVGGAHVRVTSALDPHNLAETLADGEGRYAVTGVFVGPVSVLARKAYDNGATVRQGTAGGRIVRAGATTTIDVVIDSGSASIAGRVLEAGGGATTPAAGALVTYSVGPAGAQNLAAGVITGPDGAFAFPSVPAGAYQLNVTLPTSPPRYGQRTGLAQIGDVQTGIDVIVQTVETATVRGRVRHADGAVPERATVQAIDRLTTVDADGRFEFEDIPVDPVKPLQLRADTSDRRSGTASVLVAAPGVIEDVHITVSALGSAEFTVFDEHGQPLALQNVVVLADQFGLRGACAIGCGCSIKTGFTGADGKVRFDDLPAGVVRVRVTRETLHYYEIAEGRAVISGEGAVALGVVRFLGTGRVRGTVLQSDGRPAIGAIVDVRSRAFQFESCTMGARVASHTVRTDHLGRFDLPAVGVGDVAITATHPFEQSRIGTAVVITRPGEEHDVTLRLVNTFAGDLTGRVLAPDGVTPAGAGVQVVINGPLPDVTVRTDADGLFRFAPILPSGRYTMTVADPITGRVAQDVIQLKAGQDLFHEVRLKGHGAVRVRVVDALDQPVPRAVVTLREAEYPRRQLEGVLDESSQGVITFARVFEGGLAIDAVDSFNRGGRVAATLPAADATIDVTVRLSMSGTVTGRFLLPDGTPVPFGLVKLIAGSRTIGQATTASSGDVGRFEFHYVPAGPVRLEAEDPASARTGVAAGTITAEGEVLALDVHAQGLGTVTGLVTSNGLPLPAARVEVAAGGFRVTMLTDGAGHYTIDGVPEGLVSVKAASHDHLQSGTASASLAGDGTTLTIDVAVRDVGRLTGVIVPAVPGDPPPAIVTVRAGSHVFSTVTDDQGQFTFERVPAQRVRVDADVIGSIDGAALEADVAGNTTTEVTLTLRGVGSITGVARDSSGAPVAGTVTIVGQAAAGLASYSVTLSVGATGEFRLPVVLAGPFTATLRVTGGAVPLYGSVTGTVAAGADTAIDVRVQESATITGVVLRADGVTPAIGANVTLRRDTTALVVQAQSDGRFTAAGMPLGTYTLSVSDPFTGGVAVSGERSIAVDGGTLDFETIVLDEDLVRVISIDPPAGALDIGIARPVLVTMSDPMQSTAGFEVRSGAQLLSTVRSLSSDKRTVTLAPAPAWPDGVDLTVTVTTTATDIYGRHPAQAFSSHFRTADVSPPEVIGVTPINGAVQIDPAAAVVVTFDEPLAASTPLASLVTLTGPAGPVAGQATLQGAVVTFTPDTPMAVDALYSVIVNGAVDAAGNTQTTPFTSSFATVDTVPPSATMTSPPAWTSDTTPLVRFALADATSGIDTVRSTLAIDGAAVSRTVTSTAMTFTPTAPLGEGPHSVSAVVFDRAGHSTAVEGSFGVDSVAPGVPTLAGVTDGQFVSGTISVSATAADATSGVDRIDVLRDGVVVLSLTGPAFEGSVNTASWTEGARVLTARAVDRAGNTGPAGAPITVIVNNDPLTLFFTAPSTALKTNTDVFTAVTVSEAVTRVEFTLGETTVADATAPYSATLPLGTLPDGVATITARAIGGFGEEATATRTFTIDRTPPARPDVERLTAEPPVNGASAVIGYAGAVEPGSSVEVTNMVSTVSVTVTAGSTGAFTTTISAAVDDLLSIVARDGVGNASPAAIIAVRQSPSIPPDEGATSLRFDGLLVDRVSAGAGSAALTPDGVADAVFTLSMSIGDGITRQLEYIDLVGPATRSTRFAAGAALGVAAEAGGVLLNGAQGEVAFAITSGATLTLFAHDGGFIREDGTYTATASFTDGSQFVASVTLVPPADRAQVAHMATIAATPRTVIVPASAPGSTWLTITDIRDIDGTLVPDGARIAMSMADMATRDPRGAAIRSAGGAILGGDEAPNNPNFRVFTINGGQVVAEYSSAPVTPAAITGATAVVQLLAADANGHVLGDRAIAAYDLALRAAGDRAHVSVETPTMYGDGVVRSTDLVIDVRDASGAPMADGSKVVVGVGDCATRVNGVCIASAATGTLSGGEASPSPGFRAYTVVNGRVLATYSTASTSQTDPGALRTVTLQVASATATGALANSEALGTGSVTLTGLSMARVQVSPARASLPATLSVVIDHLHDTRGNPVPDGANVALSANDCATRYPDNTCIVSVGGSIVDGTASATSGFRWFPIQQGRVTATYSSGSLTAVPGEIRTAVVQVAAAGPTGTIGSNRAVGHRSIALSGPTDAVGVADPPSLLADGALRTTLVRFTNILDGFGNPVPDGVRVGATVNDCGARDPNNACIASVGGQILNGEASPSSGVKVFTIANGAVDVQYGQSSTAAPGQILVANLSLVPVVQSNGAVQSTIALGTARIDLGGLTSAQVMIAPSVLFADGADRRAMVTITDLRDALGQPVPDGVKVNVTARHQASFVAGVAVSSAGGRIVGGEAASTFGTTDRVFPVTNGQIVAELTAENSSFASGEHIGVVQLRSSTPGNAVFSNVAVATREIRLVGPAVGGAVTFTPTDLLGDRAARVAAVVITGLVDAGGQPLPDGAKVALTVANNVATAGGALLASAGGSVQSAGVTPGDGAASTGSSLWRIFTVAGGQVRATYSADTIVVLQGQTAIARLAVAPASAGGSLLSSSAIAHGAINLRAATSATASGPATLGRSATTTVTFSAIKDSAGNTLPDGAKVIVTAVSNQFLDPATNTTITSTATGGVITDGVASPSGSNLKVFTVQNGSVTATFTAGTNTGTARILIAPADINGANVGNRALLGGVLAITIQ